MLTLISCIVQITIAQVTLEVYEVDGETIFDGRDIMVGTELVFVVSSDTKDYWSGGLFVAGQDRALGTLNGRDSDLNTRDCNDSHYESAGESAKVWAWRDSEIWGFDLYTCEINAFAGDWFVIDYEADKAGDCNVDFYDYGISWDNPNQTVSFTHILPQDFNDDDTVNLTDFSIFAANWLAEDCKEPNWCEGTDMTLDGTVDCDDLAFFVEYWLWGTPDSDSGDPNDLNDLNEPGDPNEPSDPNDPGDPTPIEDPNTVYSIVDVYDSNEITMNVGDTVTLYVNLATYGDNEVRVFNLEVNIFDPNLGISDPNLGSIDNTAYDPDNPPGPGTARILASPRTSFFDYWGPGIKQEEGLELLGANIGDPTSDGHLASFEFTSDCEGDVTLNLIDWMSDGGPVYPALKSMTIHQVDPGSP
jgi:hypothetical protein